MISKYVSINNTIITILLEYAIKFFFAVAIFIVKVISSSEAIVNPTSVQLEMGGLLPWSEICIFFSTTFLLLQRIYTKAKKKRGDIFGNHSMAI